MSGLVSFSRQPDLDNPILVVSWSVDTAGLSETVASRLNMNLGNQPFCEIDPGDFFQLEGVGIENDVIQFPEPRFYAGSRRNLVVFRSAPPRFDWYRFMDALLGVATESCHVREIYAIGGMMSMVPHTAPRELVGTFSSAEMRDRFTSYNMSVTWNYETPPGQRPTLNSFLLWCAKTRNIQAATLWVPVPFYLAPVGDPKAELRVMEFFNRKLDLCLNLDELDEAARRQARALVKAREEHPDIDGFISKLERGEPLSTEDSQTLAEFVQKTLSGIN
jgi:predicted ATP-grasp superfamily ATP-dependent carboligase